MWMIIYIYIYIYIEKEWIMEFGADCEFDFVQIIFGCTENDASYKRSKLSLNLHMNAEKIRAHSASSSGGVVWG